MEGILAILSSISWDQWLIVAVAFVVAFEKLARLTPTKLDDGAVNALYKVFAVLGVKVPDVQSVKATTTKE